MNIVETTIREGVVRLLYADAQTKEDASEWVEIQVKLRAEGNQRLGVIQKDALQRVQELIVSETSRFRTLSDQIR